MTGKAERQKKILELVRTQELSTQEELADQLEKAGISVTQATISRDIRELKLRKLPSRTSGNPVYLVQNSTAAVPGEKTLRVLRDSVMSCDTAMNLLVIKTSEGMAMAAAAAIDACRFPEIVGSIAGDDTVMCAAKTSREAENLKEKLKNLLEEQDHRRTDA
ncbi:MAG: arginine repressor [Lachnospiraceae bacterium]|jgi:transcriptional regulator of arginine metabolism